MMKAVHEFTEADFAGLPRTSRYLIENMQRIHIESAGDPAKFSAGMTDLMTDVANAVGAFIGSASTTPAESAAAFINVMLHQIDDVSDTASAYLAEHPELLGQAGSIVKH